MVAEIEQTKTPEQDVSAETEQHPLAAIAHKVLLAGIGAVALAQEEIEEFVQKLVERGEVAEQDGRRMVRDVLERRKRDARKAEEALEKRVSEILGRMNVPTKEEIEALSARIAALAQKVDELKKSA